MDGGASLHTSHCQLKQWVREVNAAEAPIESRKPLKWSSTPIIFDIEDHPDRITAIECLPMLVSPTIRNLKVTKMLVDGGAGLNLISSTVLLKFSSLPNVTGNVIFPFGLLLPDVGDLEFLEHRGGDQVQAGPAVN